MAAAVIKLPNTIERANRILQREIEAVDAASDRAKQILSRIKRFADRNPFQQNLDRALADAGIMPVREYVERWGMQP